MTEQIQNQKNQYDVSLEDPRWARLRKQILNRDNQQCRLCGTASDLQVHHRQYHRSKSTGEWNKSWEYHPFFLITVCDSCHDKGHQLFSIPIKQI